MIEDVAVQDSRHTYRLQFTDLGRDLVRDTEFEATCDYRALKIAQQQALNRPVRFHRDGQKVATLRTLPGGFWRIDPVSSDEHA